jgi:hypothetical protein
LRHKNIHACIFVTEWLRQINIGSVFDAEMGQIESVEGSTARTGLVLEKQSSIDAGNRSPAAGFSLQIL